MISFIYSLMALTVILAVGAAVAGYLSLIDRTTQKFYWLEYGVGGLLIAAICLSILLMNMGN